MSDVPLPYEGESPEAYVRRLETQLRVDLYKIEEDFARASLRSRRMAATWMAALSALYGAIIIAELLSSRTWWLIAAFIVLWAVALSVWAIVYRQSSRYYKQAKAEMDSLSKPLPD